MTNKKPKKEPKDVELYSDMTYCPSCGSIQDKKENFCSQCGASLHKKPGGKEQEMEKTEAGSTVKKKTPLWKNKAFLSLVGFFTIALVVVGGVFYLKFTEGNAFRNEIKGMWAQVSSEANNFTSKVSKMSDMEDFEEVASDIKSLEDLIDNKKNKLDELEIPPDYQAGIDDLDEGFSVFKEYLEVLRSAADHPESMTNQDMEDINNLANQAETIFSRASAKLNFVEIKLSDETFFIVETFQEIREDYESELEAEEQAKAEEERQSKQELENKAKAEATVTSFMNAFIAGNEQELKKYMTTAFQKEFNYADLSSDARMYSYPESFRITETEKKSSTQYDIYGRELDVNRDSGSKWTISRHFAVIYVKSEGKWLIDRWDIP